MIVGTAPPNPNVSLVVDEDPMLAFGPIVPVTRPAPGLDDAAFRIELDDRRGRDATNGSRRSLGGTDLVLGQTSRTMDEPNTVL